MALITCIECCHVVSDKAASCPNCGCPVNFSMDAAVPAAPEPKKRKPAKRRKYKKLPNGFGSIKKLSGNRSRPFAAYPPTKEFNLNGSPVTQPAIGYYEDWHKAFDALREYSTNPYDLAHENITFSELFELYFKAKCIDNKKKKFSKASIYSTKAAFKNCSALHNRKFKDLRKYDLQNIIDNCTLKHASLELIVTLFKQMYRFAKENDVTDKDYAEFVKINIPDDGEIAEHTACETIGINQKEQYFKGGIKTQAGKNRIVPIHNSILPYTFNFNPAKFNARTFRENKFYPVLNQFGISTTPSGKKHTPHDCRHTFSWLCDKYKVNDLSKHLLMGHSLGGDIEKSVYGHRTIEELRVEINKIKV